MKAGACLNYRIVYCLDTGCALRLDLEIRFHAVATFGTQGQSTIRWDGHLVDIAIPHDTTAKSREVCEGVVTGSFRRLLSGVDYHTHRHLC